MDVLARRRLWEVNLDYGHGTGHGVGYFLNVHEGPHGIRRLNNEPFHEGCIVSDEPGYYKEGEFGIRIENLLVVVDKGHGSLGFENLTQCPYDRNLIDLSMLTKQETEYINNYHQTVWLNVSPFFQKKDHDDELALNWLKKHTAPL